MIIFFFGAILLGLFFLPQDAWCWGPVTHLDYSSYVLQHLAALPPMVKHLLKAHPHDFLYGSLAADITVGKAYVEYIYNCHNWRMGFLLLNEARTKQQKACAYGYLTHLAADTIAHNFYVPFKLIRTFRTRTLKHVYWEMRFDTTQPKETWNTFRDLTQYDFTNNDKLFQTMLMRTLFSFKTNKRIFNNILLLHRLKQWEKGTSRLAQLSRWTLDEKDLRMYRRLSINIIMDFLKNPKKAKCLKLDPTGAQKLNYALNIRKRMRSALRRRLISKKDADIFIADVKKKLHDGLHKPVDLPQMIDYI